ncbi:hypothetical protein QBC34DRAFT_307358 [Podospora aff. communis PSN243]|uniref:Uncharacterized protein n=1 Tax=Podospora aff. communis PSN243 TaxID=3040156 RepID=A0AAV9GAK8_9PEZI|nr:hypothetical protein QBC34DRAFT_307358 [Podospora aff. communis PSN243]
MMNLGLVAASGLALLQLASAACCRSNLCLKAISDEHDGLADCSAALVVTVTESASIVVQRMTEVESIVTTALTTTTSTQTASTETLTFTDFTSIVGYTQTDISIVTSTVASTETDIQSAPVTITSTQFNYQELLKARQTAAPELPDYASVVCPEWSLYTKACKCAGVEPTTITISAAVSTITIAASDVLTSVISTASSTEVEVSSVTVTTSSTQTDTITLTETVTSTQTDIATSVSTTVSIATPTTTATLTCKPRNRAMRILTPFFDSTTRYMNTVGSSVAWQTFPNTNPTPGSTWKLDADGFVEHAAPVQSGGEVQGLFVLASGAGESLQVRLMAKSQLDAAVAAGTHVRVRGCVNPVDNRVVMTARGKSNIISCGNSLYLSTGTGTDVRPQGGCDATAPVAVEV